MFTMNGRNPFKQLTPTNGKENAKKFFDKYFGIFFIENEGTTTDGNPVVIMHTAKDERLFVEKREDGIYINNNLFCGEW